MFKVIFFLLFSVGTTISYGQNDSIKKPEGPSVNSTDTAKGLTLTASELAEYNGKKGKPIYVAVDNLIYDFSDIRAWKKGRHHGHTAGADLAAELMKSPHKKAVLKKRKPIGHLVPEPEEP
jgi:predicted heme/steroid binding protein